MHGGTDTGAQSGQLRPGALQLGTGAHPIELGATPGIHPCGDDVQGLLLQGHVLLGHLQLLLQAAQFEVAAGQLPHQRHLQGPQIGTGGLQLRPL